MSSDQFDILRKQLKIIKKLKNNYRKNFLKLKRINDITESIITGFSAITTSSIIISFTIINPIAVIVGCVASTLATVGSASKRAYRLQNKVETNKNAFDNYSILERELIAILAKKNLKQNELDLIIDDLNNRLALIEDVTTPLTLSGTLSEKHSESE